jgi:hypothetical protein
MNYLRSGRISGKKSALGFRTGENSQLLKKDLRF